MVVDAGRFVAPDLNWAHVFKTIQCGFKRSGKATFGEGQFAGERVLECRSEVSLDGKEILLRRFCSDDFEERETTREIQ